MILAVVIVKADLCSYNRTSKLVSLVFVNALDNCMLPSND